MSRCGGRSDEYKGTLCSFMGFESSRPPNAKELRGWEREIVESRDLLCRCTRGPTVLDAIADLKAHGVRSMEDVVEAKKGGEFVRALDPLEEHVNEYPRHVNLEETLPQGSGSDQGRLWVVFLGVVTVAVLVLSIAGARTWSGGNVCVGVARANREAGIRKFIERTGLAETSSAVRALKGFSDDLAYDWSDSENVEEAPEHAVTLRLQGDNSSYIESEFRLFLSDFMGDKCSKTHIKVLDIGTKHIERKVNDFIRETKQSGDGELALVVFSNCVDKHSNKRAMTFKDFLNMKHIKVKNSPETYVSSRGVGFVFLGGSFSPEDCGSNKQSIAEHDFQMGLAENMIGRITYKAKLCAKQQLRG
mmetsp:Transcript_3111/g.4467  ORF Transcript_3111/g.4467 Transcript_3111/m.4467 type:complete len:361 (-) Transcript_3111:1390-2472(-)